MTEALLQKVKIDGNTYTYTKAKEVKSIDGNTFTTGKEVKSIDENA